MLFVAKSYIQSSGEADNGVSAEWANKLVGRQIFNRSQESSDYAFKRPCITLITLIMNEFPRLYCILLFLIHCV